MRIKVGSMPKDRDDLKEHKDAQEQEDSVKVRGGI